MDTKLSDVQKKQLEKIFTKIFDLSQDKAGQNPPLTDDGKQLCSEA